MSNHMDNPRTPGGETAHPGADDPHPAGSEAKSPNQLLTEEPEDEEDLDTFPGPSILKDFSRAVQLGARTPVSDDTVCQVLGSASLSAFRLAETMLKGRVRKTTGEPALAHSADIAIQARYLGFSQPVVDLALTHDIVEDRSVYLAEVSGYLEDLRRRFGDRAAGEVRIITNRYSLILKLACKGMRPKLGFDHTALDRVQRAVLDFRQSLPVELQNEFSFEFNQILNYFLNKVDLSAGIKRAEVDWSYTGYDELLLRSYSLYVMEMADAAASGRTLTPLAVKGLDMVDNLRTLEVATLWAVDRTLVKTEFFLDLTYWLVTHQTVNDTFFPLLYDFLKNELVQQLEERKRALSRLGDTRFIILAEYYQAQIKRLKAKYKVTRTVSRLNTLRAQIQELNQRQPLL